MIESRQEIVEVQLQENVEDEGKEQENENSGKVQFNFFFNKVNLNVVIFYDKKLIVKGYFDFFWN